MTNHTQRLRTAIYTLLTLLALSLTMTGWYAHGLVKPAASRASPFAANSFQGCSEKLGDGRPLCASYSKAANTQSGG
jgi:hypothetical protein